MPRLNQINALVSGKKGEVQKEISAIYHIVQKKELFDGLERRYRARDEENGEKLPGEKKVVQQKAKPLMKQFAEKITALVDLVATQDAGNQVAKADITVDEKVILANVPVTTLLFLEKQVIDWITFVTHINTPDPSEKWEYDPNTDLHKTEPVTSIRTKKIPRNHVKSAATQQHPAQVEVYYEDVQVGEWSSAQFTGRLPAKEKNEILTRLQKLRDAVKVAREHANSVDVKPIKFGEALFEFAFGSEK